ncbi:MAG TPA: BTAD domain-containing putative transcriptional regulator [Nocardioidaceae bacterium]|nr:BTAD domain-containing putative transcriptional regulator [Nocardioidaceae bacterium]
MEQVQVPEPVEVRLLGPLHVRRADGSVVPERQWRTAKTMDLLRVLALHAGQPVAVDMLVELLWPGAGPERGRASLRTAAYQIRRVLGDERHVRRGAAGLVLDHAWVDTVAYERRAEQAEDARHQAQHARVVALAHEAEALYLADVEADGEVAAWCGPARDRLRALRTTLLADAAEAALALGWMRDAAELAERARRHDPSSERAARARMRALAGVGEIEQALLAFDELRADLVARIGVDPSPQTRALHVQLLTGLAPAGSTPAAPVETSATRRLTEVLAGTGDEPHLVLVQGPPGSGRDTAVTTAVAALGLPMERAEQEAGVRRTRPHVLLETARADLGEDDLLALHERCRALPDSATLVVPVHRVDLRLLDEVRRRAGAPRLDLVPVPALREDQLAALAAAVLQHPPSARLLAMVRKATGGWAGAAARLLREWVLAGRVVWTREGMAPWEQRDGASPLGARLARMLRDGDGAMEVVAVLAVAGEPLTVTEIARVGEEAGLLLRAAGPEPPLRGWIDRLADQGVVRVGAAGVTLTSAYDRQLVLDWLPPARARHLHRALARLDLPAPARVRHLLAAGELEEAGALGLTALEAAGLAGEENEAEAEELLALLAGMPPRLVPSREVLPLREQLRGWRARATHVFATAVAAFSGSNAWLALTREEGVLSSLMAVG